MPDLHRDRARAESFGSIAEQYDRVRPTAPDALFDDLAALRPEAVLDVACGTGKVARALMARGLSVLGVELDPRMAAVARSHGVEVELGAFEDWDDRGRRFDLITCGDAWHWIDPERGAAKAALVLRPGGTLARFWNHHELDEPLASAIKAVYLRCAPEVEALGRHPDIDVAADRTYPWKRTYTAGDFVALMATYSSHQQLGPERLAALQRELLAAVEAHGGVVRTRGLTRVQLSVVGV